MEKQKAKAAVVTTLDEVAWLFNLRGSDIDFNPGTCHAMNRVFFLANLTILLSMFFSYAVVTHDSAVLFVEREQFTNDAHAALTDTVDVRSYGSFLEYLQTLPGTLELNEASVGPILLSRVVTEAN